MLIVLFCTLEDLDSKNLIRSLIFLSFEQKKLIKKLKSQIKEDEKVQQVIESRNFFKCISNFIIEKHAEYTNRGEFLSKFSEREVAETKAFIANEKGNFVK